MLWCVRAALALSVLLFIPGLRDCFEPPKVAAVRTLGIALLAFPLFAGRWRRPAGLDVAVLAWLVTEVLATAASRSPLLSLFGEPMQREGLLTSFALGGLYFAARAARPADVAGGDGGAQATLVWMISAVAAGSLYALAQGAGIDPIRWVGSASYGPGALDRPSGTFGHPNLLGVMSAAATVAALTLAVSSPRRRILFAFAAAITGAATVATLSRAAWLGLAIGAMPALVLAARSGAGARTSRAAWLAIGVLAVVVVSLLAAGWGPRLASRALEMFSPGNGAGASRIEIWRSAALAWRSSPWLGTGPDTFALLFPRFQTPAYWRLEWAGVPYHAHSIALHELATRGLVGLVVGLAWAGALIAAARAAWRARPSSRPVIAATLGALIAIAVAGLFGALGIAGALWIALGSALLAGLATPAGISGEATPPRPIGSPVRIAAAVAVAALVAAAGVSDLAASAAAREADLALDRARAGDVEACARALAAASLAARRSPLDDALHRLYAEAELGTAAATERPRDPLQSAASSARRALSLEPLRVENHEQLARVLAGQVVAGDPTAGAEAMAEIERVVASAPVNALMLGDCARLAALLGHAGRAREIERRIAELYPGRAPEPSR